MANWCSGRFAPLENAGVLRCAQNDERETRTTAKTAGSWRLTFAPMTMKLSWMGHPIVWGGLRRTGNGKGKSRSFDSIARKVREQFRSG